MKKSNELQELRTKNNKDLILQLKNSEKKLFELRFGASFKKIKNIHEVTKLRKDVARIWTVLTEKSLNKEETQENKVGVK